MAINKVEYGGSTLIDLTNDTVTAETLLQGVTAHGANGELIVGTYINHAGEMTDTYSNTSAVTVNTTSKAVVSITLTKGTWIVFGRFRCPTIGSTAYARYCNLSETSGWGGRDMETFTGNVWSATISKSFEVTSDTMKVYMNAYSGKSVSVTAGYATINAIRIA